MLRGRRDGQVVQETGLYEVKRVDLLQNILRAVRPQLPRLRLEAVSMRKRAVHPVNHGVVLQQHRLLTLVHRLLLVGQVLFDGRHHQGRARDLERLGRHVHVSLRIHHLPKVPESGVVESLLRLKLFGLRVLLALAHKLFYLVPDSVDLLLRQLKHGLHLIGNLLRIVLLEVIGEAYLVIGVVHAELDVKLQRPRLHSLLLHLSCGRALLLSLQRQALFAIYKGTLQTLFRHADEALADALVAPETCGSEGDDG